jgi:CheY-like chemotaxis protein
MPGKSGLETLIELRAMPKMANTPIVLLTQVKDKETIREAGVYKVQDYFSKPARPERVRAKIAKYLG